MCAWSGALLLKSDQGLTSYSSFWVIVGRRTVNAQARTSPNDCVRKCTECYYYCLRTLRPEINKRTSSPLCLVISHLVSDRWVEETQHFYTLVLPALPVLLSFFVAHLCNLERNWLHTFTKNLFDTSKNGKSGSIILSNTMTFTC